MCSAARTVEVIPFALVSTRMVIGGAESRDGKGGTSVGIPVGVVAKKKEVDRSHSMERVSSFRNGAGHVWDADEESGENR